MVSQTEQQKANYTIAAHGDGKCNKASTIPMKTSSTQLLIERQAQLTKARLSTSAHTGR